MRRQWSRVSWEINGSRSLRGVLTLPKVNLNLSPFQTASGNVEAKVVCFYRRRDISHSLIQLADKHASEWSPLSSTFILQPTHLKNNMFYYQCERFSGTAVFSDSNDNYNMIIIVCCIVRQSPGRFPRCFNVTVMAIFFPPLDNYGSGVLPLRVNSFWRWRS